MRRTVVLGAFAALNLLALVGVQWSAIAVLGVSELSDALFVSMTVPQFVYGVLGGSLIHVLVPLLATGERAESQRNLWTIVWVTVASFGIVCGALSLASTTWVPWLVPGFTVGAQGVAADLTRIQLLGVVALAVGTVQIAGCHAAERFVWAEAAQLLASVLSLGFAWLVADKWGVYGFAWALALRHVVLIPLLAPILGSPRRPALSSPVVAQAWRRIRPLIWGTSYYRLGRILDRLLASMAAPGAVSIFHLVEQLYGGGAQVLSKAYAAPLVTDVSRRAKSGDWAGVTARASRTVVVVAALCVAGLLFLVTAARPLIVYGCESLDYPVDDGLALWWMLLTLYGTLLCGACGQVFASAYYAIGETRVPTRIGVFGFTVGIVLKIVGFGLGAHWWGTGGMAPVFGVAAGTSLYYLLNLFLLGRAFRPVVASVSASQEPKWRPALSSQEQAPIDNLSASGEKR